jgi:hypothetical protein
MIDDEDARLLRECLAWADEREELDDTQERWCGAFRDMLGRGRPLTPGQKSYARGVHEHLGLGVHYENAFSAGRVPRGEALATPVPAVLLRPLPKRPPGRA